ncbi:Mannosylglycerate hydrolase [compost metagenome]
MEDLGLQFGYDLPDDKFRQPYMCRRVRLTFEAAQVPALGLRAYAWVRRAKAGLSSAPESLLQGDRVLENEAIKVVINANGSFTLSDKASGMIYRDLGIYENTGDIGNEYMYKQPEGEQALTTEGLQANISVLENTPYRASVEIKHDWAIPASADDKLDEEQRALVYYPERKAQRSSDTVIVKLRTVISLERGGKGLHIETTIDNQAKDHRIRVLFPTDLNTATHHVDSMFEIAERSIEPATEWMNPSNTQHQQAFVDISNDKAGLTVANFGLNEYEVLRDGRNTIAVTLLRSVGELGDWGLFPTPEAQCLGEHVVRMELIPHTGEGITSGAYAEAYQFQIPWIVCQTGVHEGVIAPVYTPFEWESQALAFSSLKMNEQTGDLLLRWYNMSQQSTDLTFRSTIPQQYFYKTTILEEESHPLTSEDKGSVSLQIGPCEIVTMGIRQ